LGLGLASPMAPLASLGMGSALGMVWRLASLGLGRPLVCLRSWHALLVDSLGWSPLWVGLSQAAASASSSSFGNGCGEIFLADQSARACAWQAEKWACEASRNWSLRLARLLRVRVASAKHGSGSLRGRNASRRGLRRNRRAGRTTIQRREAQRTD
jgi:hypothetical protein